MTLFESITLGVISVVALMVWLIVRAMRKDLRVLREGE